MATNPLQNELLDHSQQELRGKHYAKAVIYMGRAMLAGDGVVQVGGVQPADLGGYFDHRLGAVTEAVEYAMPIGIAAINAQRIRAERLEVGRNDSAKSKLPFEASPDHHGLNVSVRYPLGGVLSATLTWESDAVKDVLWKASSSTNDWEDDGRAIADTKPLARLMDWALYEGSTVPPSLHNRRTSRDRLQSVNLVAYNLAIGWLGRAGGR